MERKIVLEIEELEERIAPHCPIGMDNGAVKWHGGEPSQLILPNGGRADLPAASDPAMDMISGESNYPAPGCQPAEGPPIGG